MMNKYKLLLPLLIILFASSIFLTSKPVINDTSDPAMCNCSGPKAFKSNLGNN